MKLPVYTHRPLAWEEETPKQLDHSCTACSRSIGFGARCLGPGQRTGSGLRVLVVLSRASREDAQAGRVGVAGPSGFVFQAVCQVLPEDAHIVVDVALRCPGEQETEKEIGACRGYLANVVQAFKPNVVFACGTPAMQALTGESVDVRAIATGWAASSCGTPVVAMLDEQSVWGNTFVRERFVEQLHAVVARPAAKYTQREWSYAMVSRDNIDEAVNDLRSAPWCSWDTEFAGIAFDGPNYFEVLCHGLAGAGRSTVWVWGSDALRDPVRSEALYALLEDPTVGLCAQNGKADLVALASPEPTTGRRPVHAAGVVADPKLMHHLQEPDVDADLGTLSYLAGRGVTKGVLEQELAKAHEWIQWVRKTAKTGNFLPGMHHPAYDQAVRHSKRDYRAFAHALVSKSVLHEYQATDVASTCEIGERLLEECQDDEVLRHGWELLRPLPEVAARMEATGLAVDLARLDSFERYLRVQHHTLSVKINMAAGTNLNPGSDDEVARLLYGRIGLPILKYTDGANPKPSTEDDVLKQLADAHPVVPLIRSYRDVKTYLTRYAVGMRRHVRGDGRVHPTFNLDGTRTGRWSSADPNFQNLAEHAEMAKWVKRYLVARPGYVLMSWDYGQLEYVVASIISGDPAMQQIFRDGKDMHRRTAELVGPILWNKTIEEMEAMSDKDIKPQRQQAKAINFGALFNMQAKTLARQLGCSEQDAAKLLDAILYQLFTRFADWRDNEIRLGQQRGYSLVYSVLETGELLPVRRRPMMGLGSSSRRIVGNAINGLVNTPVQGSASIVQAKAITAIDKWLMETGMFHRDEARIVNAIHDATYLEVREDMVERVYENVTMRMVNQPTRGVPLRVDGEVGRDLAGMVSYEEWRHG